ncbi:MAG TPA: nitronate monooxygenase [Miltoncostaeaceae bacterium]|nr:nitronate monooxygenase [Miltoncostaeaceae bacterium]
MAAILASLRHPVVLAPLAGGATTPALVAAVGEAGGIGFIGAGYRTADDLAGQIAAVRDLSATPFGVNVFVPRRDPVDPAAIAGYVRTLEADAARLGVAVGDARDEDDGWDAKIALLTRDPVPVVSFTFACPPPATVRSLRDAGTEVWVTVTTPGEAREAAAAGARALVCQGAEAGGHRGAWNDRDDTESLGLLALLRLAAAATDLPLVAAGGIADGAAVAAVLAAGASAAQLGTAFLRAAEAGTHPAHRAALAEEGRTALTRAFTGRTARGIANRFMEEHEADAVVGYPQVHHATAPLRAAARRAGDAGGFNLWAGQAHVLAREAPAGDIVRALAAEAAAAARAAAARLSPPGG